MKKDNYFQNQKISIILPVLNGEKTLAACLKSLLAQEKDFLELIVVNNGSSDKTADIIKSFAKYDKRLKYIFEPLRGRGKARNVAVKAVRGDVIVMTDADCLVPKNWLGDLTKKILTGEFKAVMGFQDNAFINYWTKMRQLADEENILKKKKGVFIAHLDTKNFACEAKILKELGFDENLNSCEDFDLFLNLQKNDISIFFLPDLRVSHWHDASAREVFTTERSRAFSYAAILRKHNLPKERKIDFFSFPFWVFWQIIKSPYQAPYRIISDLGRKIGLINYYFYKR